MATHPTPKNRRQPVWPLLVASEAPGRRSAFSRRNDQSAEVGDSPGLHTGEVTRLLRLWAGEDSEVVAALVDRIYGELRLIARGLLKGEDPDHSWQATDLVHEAWLRLGGQGKVRWHNRRHFYCVAAQAMRRLLVDHARRKQSAKRGGMAQRVGLGSALYLAQERPAELVLIADQLARLAEIDPVRERVVVLRFFVGLTLEETAEVLAISRASVVRHWRLARAWLYRALGNG